MYMVSAEFAKPPVSKGEVLVFKKGKGPSKCSRDVESQQGRPVTAEKVPGTPKQGQKGLSAGVSVFHWEDLCYDIQIKGKDRRLLDQVDGWVKPGVSTALMVSYLIPVDDILLIIIRVYPEQVKRLFSTSSQPALPWAS
jgi:ATP-binding cassette subfamily G (WHITE) protein 2 (PDR)